MNKSIVKIRKRTLIMLIALPIYLIYMSFFVFALGVGDDIWDGLSKRVEDRLT